MVAADVPTGSDKIVIESAWSEKDMIKQIPGTRWDADGKVWTAPLTWASCVQLRGIFGANLLLGEGLREWAKKERTTRLDVATALRSVTTCDELDGTFDWMNKLYSFQRAGVAFLLASGSALLTDEMGTGKTVQMLSTLRSLHQAGEGLPALVICPNSMKAVWKREAADWFPDAVPYVVQGTAVARRKTLDAAAKDPNALVIINFESVRAHSRTAGFGSLRLARCSSCDKDGQAKEAACEVHERELNKLPFKVVTVDEAHRIKDPNAKQTRAIWSVGQNHTVSRRFAMTGTPLANSPADLWSIMHFVAPDEYPTKSKFVDRYCEAVFNGWGGLEIGGLNKDTKEELFKILHPRMRRMSKKLVLTQLPEKVYTKRYVQLTKEQRKAYDQMADGLVSRLEDGTLMVTKDNIVANTRLLQFSSGSMEKIGEQLNPKTGEMEDIFAMRDPSPKLDAMEEIIEEMDGKQIVVAAVSRQLIGLAEARLTKAGISFGRITGDTKQWERDAYIQQFQKGELQVMLLTMQAGGVGITLTAADTILFLQRSWSMVENKQTVDRVHRIGSEKFQQINVIDLVAEDTVEEKQIVDVWIKEQKLEEVVEDQKALAMAS